MKNTQSWNGHSNKYIVKKNKKKQWEENDKNDVWYILTSTYNAHLFVPRQLRFLLYVKLITMEEAYSVGQVIVD